MISWSPNTGVTCLGFNWSQESDGSRWFQLLNYYRRRSCSGGHGQSLESSDLTEDFGSSAEIIDS